MSAVTVINSFEVPVGREGEFVELWKNVNAYMRRKPGYLGNKLHRAITPDAPFQFVHVGQWASMAYFEGAHDAGFRELVAQPAWAAFLSHRVLLEVVDEGQGEIGSSEDPQVAGALSRLGRITRQTATWPAMGPVVNDGTQRGDDRKKGGRNKTGTTTRTATTGTVSADIATQRRTK